MAQSASFALSDFSIVGTKRNKIHAASYNMWLCRPTVALSRLLAVASQEYIHDGLEKRSSKHEREKAVYNNFIIIINNLIIILTKLICAINFHK